MVFDEGRWVPYPEEVSAIMENLFARGEFKEIVVSKSPNRVVEYVSGGFFQFDVGFNKAQSKKPVQRGFNGQINEIYNDITTTIKTVTREVTTTGPGTAPYTKVAQPSSVVQQPAIQVLQQPTNHFVPQPSGMPVLFSQSSPCLPTVHVMPGVQQQAPYYY